MLRKLILSLIVLSASVPAALAYDFALNGIFYNIAPNGKSVSVTYRTLNDSYYTGDLVIPDSVTHGLTRYPVKEIEDLAFFNCQGLNTVTMGNEITVVGDQAFCRCYWLTDITFSKKLQRIGDYAFQYCEDLQRVALPATLTQIGDDAFSYCRTVSAFEIDEANPVYTTIDGVIYTKSKRQLVMYPAAKTDAELTLPDETEIIQVYALAPQPYLTKINIGPKVKTIQSGTFSECTALQSINVSEENPYWCSIDGALLNKDATVLMAYPMNSPADVYEAPATVTTLADLSMLSAKRIIELTLPASLTTIGDYALLDCVGVLRVTCNALTPPQAEINPFNTSGMIFNDEVYTYGSLTVPEESAQLYRADREWGRFSIINDVEQTAITEITGDAGDGTPAPVYDLMGRRLSAPVPGTICIVGGKKTVI